MDINTPIKRGGTPRRRSLKDDVADYLRTEILSGVMKPGQKVDQDAVAAALDVSKLPVREALIALESEALIENIPRRGAFVASLTPEDVFDHYAIYGLISSLSAERAAERLSDKDLERLEEINKAMANANRAEENEQLNFEFHRIINQAGASRRLASVLRLFALDIPNRFFEFTPDWNERAVSEHREIIERLRARDGAGAAEAMSAHLRSGGEYAVRALQAAGFWDKDEKSAIDRIADKETAAKP